ncbi:MAG: molybdopterin-dependent oxidoreductase [Chloroflexi bacterium]|nr:molybdopterin-dependent oxidoreductase [Chloroflexota bacterium]
MIVSGCPYDCGGSCPLAFYVDGGEVRRIGPFEEPDSSEKPQLRPCARGLAQAQRVHHPGRLLYPMRRVGARGEGRFERISWDEALDTVAEEMRRIKQRYGAEAILNLKGSANTDGLIHRTALMAERFFGSVGGYTGARGTISFEALLFAARHTFGFAPAPPGPESLLHSKLVIVWGMNPAETVEATNTNYEFALARERGTRFIFVDPRFTDSVAALADQWIPILPGTDAAMLVAMAHVLIEENLYDEAFLTRYTYGFDKFRDYCLGIEDGIAKTPNWAEGICGVRAEVIADLARTFAGSRPADLRPGWAPGRTAFGEQTYRASAALAAMTGNIGIPGGGPGCSIVQNHREVLGVSYPPAVENPARKSIVGWQWADAVIKGKAGGYPSDIKMIYSMGGNRLNQCADTNSGVKALKKVEFVVVQDQFLTPTARFADLVLPVSTHLEREDIQTPHIHGDYLIYNRRTIEPRGESKSDLEIFAALARRLGATEFGDRSEREWLDILMAKAPVTPEALRDASVHRIDLSKWQVPLADFIADPDKNPLPTPSGKIEIYSQALAQRQNPGLPAVPKYMDGWESPSHPLARKYPLLLVTAHGRLRVNSTFDNVPWLRELEPHAVWINTVDAQARGIRDGDVVQVHNDIGIVEITARVTERIIPGVVSINQGAWYRPDERGVDIGGCVNTLCKDTISPGEASATNAVLVEVSPSRR